MSTAAQYQHDRRRAAFTVNENGRTAVYLFDPRTREYRRVDSIPVGLVGGLEFSPDDTRLAMTINTAKSPSDTYVLELGPGALDYAELVRWTQSEVGGLDTTTFIEPELIEFPTFDEVDGAAAQDPGLDLQAARQRAVSGCGLHPRRTRGPGAPVFRSTYQLWLEKLGVAVIVPNVRGSAGYGKTYVELDNGFKREDSVRISVHCSTGSKRSRTSTRTA